MSKFFKRYIGIIIAWLIVIILSIAYMPSISHLVNQKGETHIPSSMQSQVAAKIGDKFHKTERGTRPVIVVFNSKKKLNSEQVDKMYSTIGKIQNHQKKLGIKSMVTPPDTTSSQKQLIAKDSTTQIITLNVDKKVPIKTMNARLIAAAKTPTLRTYVTSYDTIQRQTNDKVKHGITKAEIIISIFILLILVLVFRSLILPVISLITTLMAYYVSLCVVGNLSISYGLPVSIYTQAVLMLVMMALGTEYQILFFNELKRQFVNGKDETEATIAARKQSGKSILVSGIVLAIAFGSLGFIDYSMIQSLASVGIGIIVLLLAVFTFLPFFTFALGKRIFLPSTNLAAHNYSKSWGFLASKSSKYPLISLALVILIAIPFVLNSRGKVSFDPTREVATKTSSATQGYKSIKEHYPKGTAEPLTVYIKSDHKLDNDADLREIDRVTTQLENDKMVSSINSVTQPEGEPLQQLYMKEQIQIVTGSIGASSNALNRVAKGLKKTKIDNKPLSKASKTVSSITNEVNRIQTLNAANNVTETPSQIVQQVQAELQLFRHKRMTRFQREVVKDALQRSMVDQAQQNKMNDALNRIGMRTDSTNSRISNFEMELNSIQSRVQNFGTQIADSTKEIGQSKDFLDEMAKSPAGQTFYIPKDVLNSATFQQAVMKYLSDDKKTAKINVILNKDPHSSESLQYINDVSSQLKASLAATTLQNATVVVGGVPSTIQDARSISKANFNKTALIFAGVLIVLSMFVAASILQAAYVGIVAFVTYLMSLGFSKWMSSNLLDQHQLTASVPYLLFILLFAFAINYSLYLFIRNRQNSEQSFTAKMQVSAGLLGTVIIFAISVVIANAASLMTSSQLTLIQLAMGLIFGLIVIGLVIPITLPGLDRLTYDNYFQGLFSSKKKVEKE